MTLRNKLSSDEARMKDTSRMMKDDIDRLMRNGWLPVTGEADRVEDHAFAAAIAPTLPTDAEEEELAVCNAKFNGL